MIAALVAAGVALLAPVQPLASVPQYDGQTVAEHTAAVSNIRPVDARLLEAAAAPGEGAVDGCSLPGTLRRCPIARRKQSTLVAAIVAASLGVIALVPEWAVADTRVLRPVAQANGSVKFKLRGVRPAAIRRARLRAARRSHPLRLRRVRRAARSGVLRVRVPRRLRVAVRRHRRQARLVLDVRRASRERDPSAGPGQALRLPPHPAWSRVASFETGDFSEVDNWSYENGFLSVTGEVSGFGDRMALKVEHGGRPGLPFARVWYATDWTEGSDVWYGAAFYIPDLSALEFTNLIRWDNHKSFGNPGGDVGGFTIVDGRGGIYRADYGADNYTRLGDAFDVPEGRWFWIEVHQRLSGTDGKALTEAFLDGRRVAVSTNANSRGRQIDHIRYGYVAHYGPPSAIYLDKASLYSPE